MKYKVGISGKAKKDIQEIYTWLEEKTPFHVDQWYQQLVQSFFTLREFPRRFPRAPERKFLKEDVHQMLFGKGHGVYRIIYQITGNEVVILHVRHTSRKKMKESD